MFLQNSIANKTNFQATQKRAFTDKMLCLSYENANKDCLLLEVFLKAIFSSLQRKVIPFLQANIAMKFNMELQATFIKPYVKVVDKTSIQQKIFRTEMQESFSTKDFLQNYLTQVVALKQRTEEFQVKEGGWTLLELVRVDFKFVKYQPLRGASYLPLPEKLRRKQACINVQNNDVFCFKWALLSAFAPTSAHYNRTSSYKVDILSKIIKFNDFEFNFSELKFPLQVEDVSVFENNNPGISVNVFGYDESNDLVIGPYYKTNKKRPHHVNLLYIQKKFNNKKVGHYIWIKNFSRLIRSQMTKNKASIEVCDVCLQWFSKELKEMHREECCRAGETVDHQDKCALEFRNSIKRVEVPFVVYANMKTFSKPARRNALSFVFTYFIKSTYDSSLEKWQTFKGATAPAEFVASLIKDAKYYYENYLTVTAPKVPLTEDEELEFAANACCCLCSKEIPDALKVKLHCRLTGNYKGPAHHVCAFNHRIPKKIPVIFANLSVDDCYFLIKQLSDVDGDPIAVIPINNESTISFRKDIKVDTGKLELRFLNFTNFLSSGLSAFIKMMTTADFQILKDTYPEESKFKFALTEILYPYEYLNCIEQLEEKCLPSIEHFYDRALDEECSAEHYAHAQNMWLCFECRTLQDYLSLCLKIDIILLADVFEKFRLVCRHAYSLEPCHYYSAADLSWDALLKVTDVKLNLPTDAEICKFLEKGLRVGIAKCFHRHSMANNKYLSGYQSRLPSKYLMHFHANDIYGRVMTDYLPEGNFEWETDLNVSVNAIPSNSEYGYIFEVDLEYPSSAFETHKMLPFCCENANLTAGDTGDKNLVVSMSDKSNYIIYYKNLQQCLKHGLKIKQIHRILKFKQSNWMKKYIVLNKTPGSNCNDAFGIQVLSLMNVAIYEKIMERPEKKIKILDEWESDGRRLAARAFIAKPNFTSLNVLAEQLVTVENNTNTFKHVPVYLELIIAELVKLRIYSFHYDYVVAKYSKTNVVLNYIDADSLIYTITTEDLYRDIKADIYSMINAADMGNSRQLLNTLGMMRDGNEGVVLKEFIGFRPKLYTLKLETSDDYVPNRAILSNYIQLLYKYDFPDVNDLLKLQLYQNYKSLLEKGLLPAGYSEHTCNALSEEIMNKLISFYYQKPQLANTVSEEDVILID